MGRRDEHRRGFTLIELLVVVAILATIAGGVISSLDGVEADAAEKVGQHEIVQLRDAVLRFRADTGVFPKQGASFGAVPTGVDATWFAHPANWGQLLTPTTPLLVTDPLHTWNRDSRRGWRGPYVRCGAAPSTIDTTDWIEPDGDTKTPTVALADMPSVLDPYGRPYLLLDLDVAAEARLVSLGLDGLLGTTDDVVVDLR